MKHRLVKSLIPAVLCAAWSTGWAWPQYTVTSLLAAPPGALIGADDVNDVGHVLARIGVPNDLPGYYLCREGAGCAWVGSGDALAFAVVCALSGVALGTDLALPGALLAGVVDRQGDRDRHEGVYFGWWNFATKLNLALAAGLALPLLGWWGYTPGTRSDDGLHTLGLAYAVLPCALKLLAALALYWLVLRPARGAAGA